MALVILAGLFSATALNMLVVPAAYWLFGQRPAVQRANGAQRLEPIAGDVAPAR